MVESQFNFHKWNAEEKNMQVLLTLPINWNASANGLHFVLQLYTIYSLDFNYMPYLKCYPIGLKVQYLWANNGNLGLHFWFQFT